MVYYRCRSKKIRCDGIRPCCSQCSNVGFECKTSDKLSRRAFPRGYTESLEERVRSLETEVRELKALLDEKDEKIDMLTKLHPQSSSQSHLPSPRRSSAASSPPESTASADAKDDLFKVQQSPYLSKDANTESYFSGTSSGKTLIGKITQGDSMTNTDRTIQTLSSKRCKKKDARPQKSYPNNYCPLLGQNRQIQTRHHCRVNGMHLVFFLINSSTSSFKNGRHYSPSCTGRHSLQCTRNIPPILKQ